MRAGRRDGTRFYSKWVVVVASAVIVVAIALIIGVVEGRGGRYGNDTGGPLVSVLTGTTDQLTQGEATTGPTIPSAPGRVQPSEQEWAALLPKLQQAAEADPNDINAQRKLALAYYNLDRLDEAEAIYLRLLAAKEDPVLRNRLGNTLRDKGDTAGAEKAYKEAISDDPTLAPPYLNLAELLWRQGKDTDALALLDEGLTKVPEENRALLQKGRDFLKGSS